MKSAIFRESDYHAENSTTTTARVVFAGFTGRNFPFAGGPYMAMVVAPRGWRKSVVPTARLGGLWYASDGLMIAPKR